MQELLLKTQRTRTGIFRELNPEVQFALKCAFYLLFLALILQECKRRLL
jgi:hypothetical protein